MLLITNKLWNLLVKFFNNHFVYKYFVVNNSLVNASY